MSRRRLWLEVGLLLATAAAFGVFQTVRRGRFVAASPVARVVNRPIDLARHDGQTIDFSSGRPVVKDTPTGRAALARTLKEMEEAARTVTFAPPPPSTATQKPAAPPPP